MAALGIPLALLLGAIADLVGSILRGGPRFRSLRDFLRDLRRAVSMREPATLLEVVGAGAALLGAGLVAAGAIGASPGDPVLLTLALGLAVVGAHLAAIEPPTRPAAARARARVAESALVVAGAAAGLVALFLRWRAVDLASVWGAGEVLGLPLAVGPPIATVGHVVALLALAAAAGLLVPLESERPRGRYRRPAAAALLVRLSRWGVAGAVAALLPALSVGFELTRGGDALAYTLWAGAGLVGTAAVGGAWGGLDRLGPRLRLRVAVPALLGLGLAGVALVSAA